MWIKTFQFTWLLFNTLKQYFLFDMIAGSAKVFFLFCQIPSILCNTHLPFQSLPNTQLSILQMPISVHCNESRAACWDKVFLLLGDLSVPVFPNIGENAQSSVQFTEFSCFQYFSNSIQSHYNPFVLKLTNEHREHRQGWFIPNNRITSTWTVR